MDTETNVGSHTSAERTWTALPVLTSQEGHALSAGEPPIIGKGLARDSWLLQEVRPETGRDNCMTGAAGRGWAHGAESKISQLCLETTSRLAWLQETACSVKWL